ncbi:MAG TPA: 30S ribosomal protein S12 methylthiotransferase RimO [Firmicutes bacterium]|nr:30S ribosomal protein S12 methylthiotransferase RimO [Bacillota bacterium]
MVGHRKVALISLGCSKNLVDSERMLGVLLQEGYEYTPDIRSAHVVIVNTCGFIRPAKEESIETILEIAREKEHRSFHLIVAGCLPSRYGAELAEAMPEVDGFLGIHDVGRIVDVVKACESGKKSFPQNQQDDRLDAYIPRVSLTPRSYSYLKIAEGCDNHCSYCAIPLIRGRFRSAPMDALVAEATALAARGTREIVLVAQETTRYGEDIYGKPALVALLRRLSGIEGIEWLRLMYTHPSRLSDELLDEVAQNPKIVKYLDIPLQHVSERILRLMNRPSDFEGTRALLARVRKHIPGVAIRSTFMVGFPSETEEDFEELIQFVLESGLEQVGFFAYSREEGTRASYLPGQVKAAIKKERLTRAYETACKARESVKRAHIGKTLPLLVDKTKNGRSICRSYAQAPEVDDYVLINRPLDEATFVRATVTSVDRYCLIAEPTN